MASNAGVVSIPRIIKGPSRLDLLEAMFFRRDSVLTFDLDKPTPQLQGTSQLIGTLLGMIPTQHSPQSSVLIVSYVKSYEHGQRNEHSRTVFVYDDHNRSGRFTGSRQLDALLAESWYTTYEREKGDPFSEESRTTIVVTPRPQVTGPSDYKAEIEGQHGRWDCGRTPNEAIGALIRSNRDRLNFLIKDIESL